MSRANYLAPPGPRVFGHRGACGLAPENTLPSFALAAALGASYLELDVHATQDGTVVVFHDEVLDRTTNGTGPIKDLTWSQLTELDAGYRFTADGTTFPYRENNVIVPTLASVLQAFPAHRFNIEIKQGAPAIVEEVVSLLRKAKCSERTLLAAEHGSIMRDIRDHVGDEIATGYSTDDVLEFFGHFESGTMAAYTPPGVALQIPTAAMGRELVTAQSIAAAHSLGLEIHVWTINDADEIGRLFELGVDGVMSDFPGLVATAVRRLSA